MPWDNFRFSQASNSTPINISSGSANRKIDISALAFSKLINPRHSIQANPSRRHESQIFMLAQLRNTLGQTLLSLDGENVVSISSNVIANFRQETLLNLQGQALAAVNGGIVQSVAPMIPLEVTKWQVIKQAGQFLATIEGGTLNEPTALAAAYAIYCC